MAIAINMRGLGRPGVAWGGKVVGVSTRMLLQDPLRMAEYCL
jgi:hypothetical protein